MKAKSWRLPLSEGETARLYWELSRREAFCEGERRPWRYGRLTEEELHVLAVLASRYDPRLMAILVDYFSSDRPLDPVRFKKALRKHEALTEAAVIGEFVLSRPVPETVRDFFHFLTSRVRAVPTQLYYRGLYPVAGRKMEEAVDQPLWGFKKWGYLAADPPFLKDAKAYGRTYLFDLPSRLRILRELSRESPRFRLRDYLARIGGSISRQQALKDLKVAPWLKKRGQGKGTYYYVSGES